MQWKFKPAVYIPPIILPRDLKEMLTLFPVKL